MSKEVLVETPLYKLSGELESGSLVLHLDYLKDKFTKSIYKQMLSDWLDITEGLKEAGVAEVFSAIAKDEHKICKWQAMFGLEPYKYTDEAIIYRREL